MRLVPPGIHNGHAAPGVIMGGNPATDEHWIQEDENLSPLWKAWSGTQRPLNAAAW